MNDKNEALRLQNHILFPMYLCVKEMTNYFSSLLEPYGLTYTQFIVLIYLWEMGKSSLTEASDALMLDPSTLTPVLKKLQSKGYITRERDEADGRTLILKPSGSCLDIIDKIATLPEKALLYSGLNEDELETFRFLAVKTIEHINKEKGANNG